MFFIGVGSQETLRTINFINTVTTHLSFDLKIFQLSCFAYVEPETMFVN